MTEQKYERWKDFARRMVNVAVSARKKSPSRAATLEIIEFFFECRMDPYEEWKRVKNWDHTRPEEGERSCMGCGDHIRDIEEYHVPGYWGLCNSERGQDKIDRWMGPAHSCIRAGLGCAVKGGSGMGVMGFTAGDIRRMYPEGVPDWVTRGNERWNAITIKGVIPGVGFVPGEAVPNDNFASMPDSAEIWL